MSFGGYDLRKLRVPRDGIENPPREGAILGLSGPFKNWHVSAAVFAAQGIIQSSITAPYAVGPLVKIRWPLVFFTNDGTSTLMPINNKQKMILAFLDFSSQVVDNIECYRFRLQYLTVTVADGGGGRNFTDCYFQPSESIKLAQLSSLQFSNDAIGLHYSDFARQINRR